MKHAAKIAMMNRTSRNNGQRNVSDFGGRSRREADRYNGSDGRQAYEGQSGYNGGRDYDVYRRDDPTFMHDSYGDQRGYHNREMQSGGRDHYSRDGFRPKNRNRSRENRDSTGEQYDSYEDDEYYFRLNGKLERSEMGRGERPKELTEKKAKKWADHMQNADGTTGAHWSMEQVEQLIEKEPDLQEYNPADVFAAINMFYSDYCEVAKKFGVGNIDFYICMVKAWLDDDDVTDKKSKTARYYECVVK